MTTDKRVKRVKRDSKEPAAGKLKQAARSMAKLFTPTAEQPKDPNAKPAKKPGMTNMAAWVRAAQRGGSPNLADRVGCGGLNPRWLNPWS